jgi:modulator of FtsH protease
MAYGTRGMTFGDKISRNIEISESHSLILRKSYLLLSLAVIGMMVGGKIGISSPVVLGLFTNVMGWILAMIALNAVPMLAMKFRHDPTMGTIAVFLDGFVAGLVISPMLYIAERFFPGQNLVASAAWITLALFLAVTGYVYFSGLKWAPSRALFITLPLIIIGAIVINMFLNNGILGMAVSAAIGAYGIIILVSATSELLHNREIDSPVPGALMLFAGIFMIFQAILHLLMLFGGGGDE